MSAEEAPTGLFSFHLSPRGTIAVPMGMVRLRGFETNGDHHEEISPYARGS